MYSVQTQDVLYSWSCCSCRVDNVSQLRFLVTMTAIIPNIDQVVLLAQTHPHLNQSSGRSENACMNLFVAILEGCWETVLGATVLLLVLFLEILTCSATLGHSSRYSVKYLNVYITMCKMFAISSMNTTIDSRDNGAMFLTGEIDFFCKISHELIT